MKRDGLREAARALRESADEAPVRPEETRARVVASVRRRRARRIAVVRTALPLAAVLVGSMAWAAATGRLPSSLRELLPGQHTTEDAALAARPVPAAMGSLPAPSPDEPPALEAPPPAELAAPSPEAAAQGPSSEHGLLPSSPEHGLLPSDHAAPRANTAAPKAAVTSSHSPAATPRAPRDAPPPSQATSQVGSAGPTAPVEPDEHALYTTAHKLHFAEHNPGAALTAWDAYLRAAPSGRFAVEAQYNRALCLVRLGRTAEAHKTLEGFASGAYGRYRQAEARTLLDAIEP